MIDTNYRIVLGSLRYKSAPDVDFMINTPLNTTSKDYLEFDRNLGIDLSQVFDDERQKSTIIRPATKITYIMNNTYSGITNYSPYQNYLYYVNEESYSVVQNANPGTTIYWGGFPQYNEFDLIRIDNEFSGYTSFPNEHIQFVTKSASSYNWNFFISYAYENDPNKALRIRNPNPQDWIAKDGIPFQIDVSTAAGSNLVTFKCQMKHGVTVGEYIQLLDPFGVPYLINGEDIFQVYSLGNGLFQSEEYYINIFNYGFASVNIGNVGTLKRIIDINNSGETISKYYVRKHKILTNVEDAVIVKAGFENNIFSSIRKFENRVYTPNNVSRVSTKEGNQSYSLTFSRDIDISKLLDNQKRPITELFFTIVHVGRFGWFYQDTLNRLPLNPNASLIKEGWEFNLQLWKPPFPPNSPLQPSAWWRLAETASYPNLPSANFYTRTQLGNTYTFYYNNSLKSGDTIYGDFCEWNDFDQTERVISEYVHKIYYNQNNFDIISGSQFSSSNPFGFYYKPHSPITIRVYSDYIEEGARETVSEIPDYAYYSQYRRSFRWRDLYTYGFIDENLNGVDYPFINGVHHPYKNTIFRLVPEGTNSPEFFITEDPIIDGCE